MREHQRQALREQQNQFSVFQSRLCQQLQDIVRPQQQQAHYPLPAVEAPYSAIEAPYPDTPYPAIEAPYLGWEDDDGAAYNEEEDDDLTEYYSEETPPPSYL